MAFKTNIQNALSRIVNLTETRYEYEAPQFFDFWSVEDEEKKLDEYDYFSKFYAQLWISVNCYNFSR